MKVSLNTVKQYIDFELPPVDELVKRTNEQLGSVEGVVDLGVKYKDAIIVKVIETQQHSNADRLRVTKIDDGGAVQDVPRDENGLVQVVCGAPNARAGMFAVWLPPKSTVPVSFDEKEPFVLDARELRGVLSQGMLAAADELAIGSDHEGILEINPDEWRPSDVDVVPGARFAHVYGLDDTIIDIENKMFTHRPDLFGQLGVAREIAGILGQKFTSPDWYTKVGESSPVKGETLELEVFNEAQEKVPRFMAVVMKNIEVKPSPLWLQCALVAMGSKPINNIVDATNYIMLLTAQPVHAYDYDKLRGHTLGTRMAKESETAVLLNGKTYELTEDDIVIVDGEGIVGLGGIMGGGNSEVSADTKSVVLEVANFDMYTVRKSSMRYGLFTDALTRFNKGQSPLQNDRILNLLMMSIKDVSPAEQASNVFDIGSPRTSDAVRITDSFINNRLGLSLHNGEITKLLTNVEIHVDSPDDHDTNLEILPPFWRTDLELPEDIVEEVGRLYGFDKLPRELPMRSMKPAAKNEKRELKQSIRENLAKAGANEVLTYSFVHEKTLRNAGQNPAHAFKLSNALSPDLQYYRLSVMPSLLDKVHMNMKARHDSFALFEIGKTHFKGEMDPAEPNVPNEDDHIALVLAYNDKHKPAGAPYYQARKFFEQIADIPDTKLVPLKDFDTKDDEWGRQLTAAYEPDRSAVIVRDNQVWGVIGEFRPSVHKAFKLPEYIAGFELHLDTLVHKTQPYHPLSRYPSVTQDISLKVASNVSYESVYRVIWESVSSAGGELVAELLPVTIYQSEGDAPTKTVTLRLMVASHDRTLRDSDVSAMLERAVGEAEQSVGAERA